MTENHPKCVTYITMRSSISPPDSGMHAIDKLIVSGGRMSYNQGRRDDEQSAQGCVCDHDHAVRPLWRGEV